MILIVCTRALDYSGHETSVVRVLTPTRYALPGWLDADPLPGCLDADFLLNTMPSPGKTGDSLLDGGIDEYTVLTFDIACL